MCQAWSCNNIRFEVDKGEVPELPQPQRCAKQQPLWLFKMVLGHFLRYLRGPGDIREVELGGLIKGWYKPDLESVHYKLVSIRLVDPRGRGSSMCQKRILIESYVHASLVP